MGFFAPECVCCGLSILNHWTLKASGLPNSEWMTKIVAVIPVGPGVRVVKGRYNGYGKALSGQCEVELWGVGRGTKWPAVYHEDCWKAAGEPVKPEIASSDAGDQGFFIERERYLHVKSPVPRQDASCPHCHADLSLRAAVERHYFDKRGEDESSDAVGFGHYLDCGTFEPDEPANLSGGVYDLADDSDRCAVCEGQL